MEDTNLKKIMYALAAVAVVLAVALAYIWYQKSSLVKDLTIEKEELTAQMIDLQNDYASLSSDYDTINSQLDSSREEVSQLIERIQKTEATNRSKIRQYERARYPQKHHAQLYRADRLSQHPQQEADCGRSGRTP